MIMLLYLRIYAKPLFRATLTAFWADSHMSSTGTSRGRGGSGGVTAGGGYLSDAGAYNAPEDAVPRAPVAKRCGHLKLVITTNGAIQVDVYRELDDHAGWGGVGEVILGMQCFKPFVAPAPLQATVDPVFFRGFLVTAGILGGDPTLIHVFVLKGQDDYRAIR
jgi:hypothetical protein